MMDWITVSIRNWEEYKGRGDVKHNSWFRCSNRLLEDPDFYHFSHEEINVWIHIMSLSSQKNAGTVRINFEYAKTVCRLSREGVLSAIKKLRDLEILLSEKSDSNEPRNADDTGTLRARDVDVTDTGATLHDRTDNTEQTHTSESSVTDPPEGAQEPEAPPPSFKPKDLLALWNAKCGNLPKSRKLNRKREEAARQLLAEEPSREYWAAIIERIEKSDWCNNRAENSTGWKATFSWLLKPDTHLKVEEGECDNREKSSAKRQGSSSPPPDPARDHLVEAIMAAITKYDRRGRDQALAELPPGCEAIIEDAGGWINLDAYSLDDRRKHLQGAVTRALKRVINQPTAAGNPERASQAHTLITGLAGGKAMPQGPGVRHA